MHFSTRSAGIKLLFFFFLVLLNNQGQAQGWSPLTHSAPHYNAGVMLLLTDGSVMCKTSSGGSGQGTVWDRLKPDANGSYLNGTWTSLAAMHDDRLYFSTQVLKDRRVYAAGGEYGDGGPKSEVYNPLTNTWTVCPQIVTDHNISDANSEMLPNHKVLQAVVDTANTKLNFIWDPQTNTYTQTASCLRRDNEAAWVKLPDNSILFIDNYSTTSERYMPATNTWINDGSVPDELFDPFGFEQGGAFLLPNGKAYFIGSTSTSAYYTPSGTTAPGTWTSGPAIPGALGAPDAASGILPNGIILMALSATPNIVDTFPSPTYFYEFNYLTGTYTDVGAPDGSPSLPTSSFITNMLVLPDGTILYASQGDDQYYEYAPSSAPLAAGKPTVGGITRSACDTFMATGTLFNGITEGASYGDDWQMNTNYPIIRLTSGANVYYASTYNWNSTGVMRGAQPDTTSFILPAGLPAGPYTLQVVVNGNPSAAVAFNAAQSITPATSTLCAGNTETLTDTWSGGTWSSSNTAVASVNSTTGVVTGTGAGTATITHRFGAACSATATVTVSAGPGAIGGLTTVCVGASTILTASGIGTWASTNTSVATVGTSGSVSGIAVDTVTVTFTLGTGCSSSIVMSVNSSPAAISGPSIVCLGSVITLSDPGGGTWTSSIPAVATVGSGSGIVTGAGLGTTVINYSLAAGCFATKVVTVTTGTPATITPLGPTTFCSGGSVTLSGTSGSGLTYQWQSTGAPIPGATGSSYVVTGGGTYTVLVSTTGGGCSATSSATTVTVIPGPGATITPAGPTSFCLPGSVLLNANTGTGITYQWQVGSVSIPGATTSSYTASSSGNYTVIVSSGACVVTSSSVTVTAMTSSVPPVTGPGTVCVGDHITLSDPTSGGTWSSSDVALASISGSGVVSGLTAGVVVISYTATTTCGPAFATDSIAISPLETPSVSMTASPTGPVCPANTILFTASPLFGGSAPSYQWTKNGINVGTGPTFLLNPPHNGDLINCILTSNFACLAGSPVASGTVYHVSVETPSINTLYIYCTDSVITPGQSVTFVATPTSGGPNPGYQWYISGAAIPGATHATFTTTALANGNVVACREVSSDPCATPNTATSRGITILVGQANGVPQTGTMGNTFSIYPNPNKGAFTITGDLANGTKMVTISVADLLGQTVYKNSVIVNNGNLVQQVILGKALANGTYIVNITSDGDHEVYHIVVDK